MNTFAVTLQGGCGCAVVHGMDGEVDLRDGLLILQVAQGGMGLGLSCCGRHAVCQVVVVSCCGLVGDCCRSCCCKSRER